jgi:hypothetical protein
MHTKSITLLFIIQMYSIKIVGVAILIQLNVVKVLCQLYACAAWIIARAILESQMKKESLASFFSSLYRGKLCF